jgi:N6-adenosine-specific RNA methylase IME4
VKPYYEPEPERGADLVDARVLKPTRYRTIVADPPWPINESPGSGWNGRAAKQPLPYSTLSLDAIRSLPVADLASPDGAHLYLWAINRYLDDAFDVCRAWGFQFSKVLVWCKPPQGKIGRGAFGATTEYVLFARRGSLAHTNWVDRNWWNWPRGRHSAKPEAFLDIVEQVSPGPYVELFARRDRLGWDTWGNESLGTASLDGEAA